jgi:hypothetical protein
MDRELWLALYGFVAIAKIRGRGWLYSTLVSFGGGLTCLPAWV